MEIFYNSFSEWNECYLDKYIVETDLCIASTTLPRRGTANSRYTKQTAATWKRRPFQNVHNINYPHYYNKTKGTDRNMPTASDVDPAKIQIKHFNPIHERLQCTHGQHLTGMLKLGGVLELNNVKSFNFSWAYTKWIKILQQLFICTPLYVPAIILTL